MSYSEGEPQKKGMSGCVIALIVVGAVGVLGVAAIAVGVALLARSAPGTAFAQTMGAAMQSQTGPSVDAMRAIGCEQATSMDLSAVAALARSVDDHDKTKADVAQLDGMFQASCVSPTLTCEQVFAAWNKGAPAHATHVGVVVTSAIGGGERCAKQFDRSGHEMPFTRRNVTVNQTTTTR